MKCPVCESPMELVTVVRKTKGSAQAIKCPQCRTSTFLTREAAARINAVAKTTSTPRPNEEAVQSVHERKPLAISAPNLERVPTSLFEDFVAWLNR